MRFVWLTDTHFDRADDGAPERLVDAARTGGADGLIHTGDIATGETVVDALSRLARPGWDLVYALGNHDFWCSSFARVEADLEAAGLHKALPLVRRYGATAIVAVDGWYDGLEGHGYGSRLSMNDWALVDEPRPLDREGLFKAFAARGATTARAIADGVEGAFREGARHALVVTHVPPFREAAFRNGAPADANYAPFFVCHQAGVALLRLASAHPSRTITVLCGHAHERATHVAAENLVVHTGAAEYGRPAIAGWVDLTADGVRVA